PAPVPPGGTGRPRRAHPRGAAARPGGYRRSVTGPNWPLRSGAGQLRGNLAPQLAVHVLQHGERVRHGEDLLDLVVVDQQHHFSLPGRSSRRRFLNIVLTADRSATRGFGAAASVCYINPYPTWGSTRIATRWRPGAGARSQAWRARPSTK